MTDIDLRIVDAVMLAVMGAAGFLWRGVHGRIRDVDDRAKEAVKDAEARTRAETAAVEARGRDSVAGHVARLESRIGETRTSLTDRMDKIETTLADMRRENRDDHDSLRKFITEALAGLARKTS